MRPNHPFFKALDYVRQQGKKEPFSFFLIQKGRQCVFKTVEEMLRGENYITVYFATDIIYKKAGALCGEMDADSVVFGAPGRVRFVPGPIVEKDLELESPKYYPTSMTEPMVKFSLLRFKPQIDISESMFSVFKIIDGKPVFETLIETKLLQEDTRYGSFIIEGYKNTKFNTTDA